MGIDLTSHRSKSITKDLIKKFELLVIMESKQLMELRRIDRFAVKKTVILSDFDKLENSIDIKDPYGMNQIVYEQVYSRIYRCVLELAKLL